MIKPFIVAAGVASGTSAVLHGVQDRAIYANHFPDGNARFLYKNPEGFRNPGERGIRYENVYLWTDDKVKLHAWMLKQSNPSRPTIVFFHGNAGNMGLRMDNIQIFYEMGVNVFIISYRGYGESQGFPSEEGIMLDIKAVKDYIFHCPNIDPTKIFIFGRSLGGAAAIYMISEFQSSNPFRGLIVENTFLSIKDVVLKLAPGLWPVSFIMRDQWPSYKRIGNIKAPILFISGECDQLVVPEHMHSLKSKAFQAQFIEFKSVSKAGHNDTFLKAGPDYILWIKEFICKALGNDSEFNGYS